ncbi:major facilitator superfamily domain-containing protein [Plectosphaerella plurivora]|uniref:Major facilitator superfamily domain-containing protein n=1 Tax=Plectosphaerella plurivora TaxID=936078 RepID=A0A9P9ADX6_9PEZI|nr:major facilitator superfamily domain-containing protein [Plectosphaerella plurivora]
MTSTSPWSWPLWWRIVILLNVGFYNMLGNVFAAGVPPLFALIMQEFRISQDEASQLSTYALLTLGISNILALPAASLIGKRYTILVSLVFFLVTCIWSAEAPTFASLRTARILGGLAGGLIEALGPSIVFETFPEHQLARAMVVYVGLLAAGSSIGPIIAGALAEGLGDWRWFLRILAIFIALNLVTSLIMLPETTHEAPGPRIESIEASGDTSSAKPSVYDVEVARKTEGSPDITLTEQTTHRPSLKQQWLVRSFSARYVEMDWKLAARSFYEPYQLIILPQILVTTLVFGLTIGWTVLISIITPMQYSPPPLLWGALPVGLMSIGPLAGLLIGLPVGGALADYLFNHAARRSGGMQNPRTRLPATIVGAMISPAGCLVVGFGLRNPSNWPPVAIGWAMLALGLTSSANVLLTYSVDTIPTRASHIGTLVNLTKNCLAFGVSYTSVSWIQAMGPVGQFGTMAGLLWFAYLLVIPVWFYSDTLIRKSGQLFG